MKIIQPGREVTQTLEAVCNNCTCQFECSEHEAERTAIHNIFVFHIKCPHCGLVCFLEKKKELPVTIAEKLTEHFRD